MKTYTNLHNKFFDRLRQCRGGLLVLTLIVLAHTCSTTMQRVTLEQLLSATNGTAAGFAARDVDFGRVSIDSRVLTADDLFWAVQGEKRDGHRFVGDAILKNAVTAVVEPDKAKHVLGPLVHVPNTLEALWKFAGWYRSRQSALVIGVTGSVGKTTTREIIYSALSIRYAGSRSPLNYNNHFGVPLSILNIEPEHEFAVLEMAASHLGEIRDLAGIAAPEIAVVTAVGEAHLAAFGTIETILQAKGELVEALPESGIAILAGDDPLVRTLADRARCPVILVGENENNDVRATGVMIEPAHVRFRVQKNEYTIPATGRHHISAALCAIALGREIGMSAGEIAQGLARFQPVEGRCRLETIGPWSIIDDTYNANPRSMQAACQTLSEIPAAGRRVLVVGDMLELGDRAAACHRQLGREAADAGISLVLALGAFAEDVVAGALAAGMDPYAVGAFCDCESLWKTLDPHLSFGDVILVKGSRGMRMERIIHRLRSRANEYSEEFESRRLLRACA